MTSGATQANQIFRRFLDRISDYAIFVLNREGHVESWNEGARAIIGYAPDEILGRSLATLFEPQTGGIIVAGALTVSAEDGEFQGEAWQIRKDGSRFFASIAITVIRDDADGIAGFGVTIRDLTERQKAEAQKAGVMASLEKTAVTDFLTGVPNRRALDAYLMTSMAKAKRQNRPLCLAMVDLDHFKAFNDSQGHQAGDAFLKAAADSWRQALRVESLLARYGGEEFTVIMPGTTAGDALVALRRLQAATPAPLTCSIGFVQWDLTESAEALVKRADRGLYAAKAGGRNRIEMGPAGEGQRGPLLAKEAPFMTGAAIFPGLASRST